MMNRKFISLILSFAVIFSLTACGNDDSTVTPEKTTAAIDLTEEYTEATTEKASEENTLTAEAAVESSTTEEASDDVPSSVADITNTASPEVSVTSAKSLAEWSNSEIAQAYKKAAVKSASSVKSQQAISLSAVSINNGQYENVIDFIMPIMSKLLANNSTETDGITGGYENITGYDIAQAKIYSVGQNTAIEMVMKEQTDGANSDSLGGTVGHAITTVGDIKVVTTQLNDLGLPIEVSAENTVIHYRNPIVKVLIGPDGKIINGTWSYTVEIVLNNYKVGSSPVETTSVVLDNTITVNGGFGK